MNRMLLKEWTVDYGQGPRPCSIPHAWRQDVDVRWEGPVVYRTTLDVASSGGFLTFDGVSYQARILVNGRELLVHEGIWDAFTVSLAEFGGEKVEIEVRVVKNGGATFPVKDVASGFLPYVFHTFGGIWRDVYFASSEPDLQPSAPPCRVKVEGTRIFVNGKPFILRGVLTWGWYPELGHPNPSDDEIQKEVRLAKEMGFNTVKFCLWVPSHRFFEILEEEGMFAWLELPLWDPAPDPEPQERMFEELRRIVLQYRRHANIIAWTCGCELSSNTTAEFRKRLYDMVKDLTGAALVKDNSGSSEMYGGDLREFGDFYDFHPYCDLPFYPVVLDSLMNGPREPKPILLGEFNDIDVHRDLVPLRENTPYWLSEDPFLNDVGVRWQHDLPGILQTNRWAHPEKGRSDELYQRMSNYKADYIRTCVQDAVAARSDIAGYVITGWRDTPISTSGVVDDDLNPRDPGTKRWWNRESRLFVIPSRKPPWVNGGNRPGWVSTRCFFEEEAHFRVGGVTGRTRTAQLSWNSFQATRSPIGPTTRGRLDQIRLISGSPKSIGEFSIAFDTEGGYHLGVSFGELGLVGLVHVFAKPDFSRIEDWSLHDPGNHCFNLKMAAGPNLVATRFCTPVLEALQQGHSVVLILLEEATLPCPMWRECMYEWPLATNETNPFVHHWEVLHDISGDRAIDLPALKQLLPEMQDIEVEMNRVDTRTYAEHPVILRAKVGKGTLVATTLRPFGGLGVQPYGVMNNPAGANLLWRLMDWAV